MDTLRPPGNWDLRLWGDDPVLLRFYLESFNKRNKIFFYDTSWSGGMEVLLGYSRLMGNHQSWESGGMYKFYLDSSMNLFQ